MKAGKVIILVGIVGAVGFGAWWYFKKRKAATTIVPGTASISTIAQGEPIPKMQTTGGSGISEAAAAICNVPEDILNEKNVFIRAGKRIQWDNQIAYPYWEAQGRGMDLATFVQQLKQEGGCVI